MNIIDFVITELLDTGEFPFVFGFDDEETLAIINLLTDVELIRRVHVDQAIMIYELIPGT